METVKRSITCDNCEADLLKDKTSYITVSTTICDNLASASRMLLGLSVPKPDQHFCNADCLSQAYTRDQFGNYDMKNDHG